MDEGECIGGTDSGKGNTKGGNNKIGMVQGGLEVLRKGQRGRLEWDLTVLPSYGQVPMRPALVGKTD